ncbi:MAG TPA: VOC family protein [Sphingomicrobium sp.]|nr:VOC family protein [Sphingomicrobium sp.]
MRIQYAILYTSDIDRVRAFYSTLLKAQPVEDLEYFVGFALDGPMLGIKRSSEPREQPGCQTVIIACQNAEEMHNACVALGAPIVQEIEVAEWGKNFSILDPDGNKVEFVEA